jgi:hypothetical protein
MDKELQQIIESVQHNCHIADARHAGDYTLCIYLLKMREMYRWEQGINFKTLLTSDDVGDWLTMREGVWDDVEEQDYQPLKIAGKSYDPFENDLISDFFRKQKLVYNAGLGIRCRPHFFVAKLEKVINHNDYTVYISGKEYARDMAAPAAMAQDKCIFIRRESLRRVIWEILDDARVTGLDNPLTRAMSFYCFDSDAEKALNEMTEAEIEYVIQHEIGEVKAGKIVGENWNEMLTSVARTQAEIMLRAVRDHLADSMTTLPKLLDAGNNASIHFYFGNMTAMRKHLAPSLIDAYEVWNENNEINILKQGLAGLEEHWNKLVNDINHDFKVSNDASSLEALISENSY